MVAALSMTLSLSAGVLGVATPATAAPAYPQAHGRCVDSTGVLGAKLCAKVTAILLRDEARTTDEIAVAVVPDTGDVSIEQWSTGLFNHWGVGKKDTDNGVLLVVAMDDHALRLATGRGMAQRLSDDAASDIIDTVITPKFSDDEYAAGILGGLDEVRHRLGHRVGKGEKLLSLAATAPAFEAEEDPADEDASVATWDGSDDTTFDTDSVGDFSDGGLSGGLVFMFFVAMAAVALIGVVTGRKRSGRRRDGLHSGLIGSDSTHHTFWSGSGSSGFSSSSSSSDSSSGSSFGGGSSDGGGSSGSW